MKKKIFIFLLILVSVFLTSTKVEAMQETLTNIDYPYVNQEVTDSLRIQGWVMSTVDTTVEVYIDDILTEVDRTERPGIFNIIIGYGDESTNPTPGFYKIIDISNYNYGNHIIKLRVIDSENNIIREDSRQFIKTYPRTLTHIDYPSINQEVTDSLKIQGWALSTVNTSVEVYIDNILTEVDRVERPGIFDIIQGYGDAITNPIPGIYKIVDISNLDYGNHTVRVKVLDSGNNVIDESSRQFKKTYPKTLTYIDYPSVNQEVTDSLKIQGWALSTASTTVEVYIDDILTEIDRTERPGIFNIIQGYGDVTTNPSPGIYKIVNINNLGYGIHTLKLRVLDSENNVIKEDTRKFKKGSPKTLINIDYPKTNQEVTDSLRIQGWVMSTANTTVEVYIDDVLTEVGRKERFDVLSVIQGYGDIGTNPTPGIYKIVDISSLGYGNHTVKVRALDSGNNVIDEASRQFKKIYPKTLTYIDYPKTNQEVTDSLRIQGWIMSTANTEVKVYIDDSLVEVDRTERPGIFNIIQGYGDINTNPTPGIYKVVDISNLSYGNHTLSLKVFDKSQNEIIVQNVNFKRKKPKSIITIDYPQNLSHRKVLIAGWYMTMENNTHAEVYFDDVKISSRAFKREDALNAYSEYKPYMESQNPGFESIYDATSLNDGTHKVTIKIINDTNNDVINTVSRNFTLQKYKGTITLDYPALANINKDFSIIGWEMSELDNSYLKVYFDNNDISNTVTRFERPDVLNAVQGYGDASMNSTPGFETHVSIANISEGKHTIKIELYTKQNDKIATLIKDIYIYSNIYNGIDISEFNHVTSWQSVRAAGIDYVIARAVVRGYGTEGRLMLDPTFTLNVSQATMNGLKVGAYVYSQAITEEEGVQEVNAMIQQVNAAGGKTKVTLPLVIDTEFSGCGGRCGRADNLSTEQRTRIIKRMAETIKANGYTPMIYASTSFLNNQLDMSQLREYSVWVAHYGVSQPSYQGPYEIWQYASDGYVPGISGYVDMDYFYRRY